MKLIDVTNNFQQLVTNQLDNTDVQFVQVYTYGKTTIVYTESPTHLEILYSNKHRNIQDQEISETLPKIIKDKALTNPDNLDIIRLDGYAEISISLVNN